MAFWRTYYHFIWATKERYPFISQQVEEELYPYMLGKVDHLGGIAHALNGVADHVHLVVSIPPRLAVSEFVKQIKGSSSHHISRTVPAASEFRWQDSYGVLSLGGKQLEVAIAYVNNQKEHHACNSTIPALEQDQSDSQSSQPGN